jgi:hypothetical protein
MQFTAPIICLVGGVGLAWLIAQIRPVPIRQWTFRAALIGLAALGAILFSLKLAHPYKDISDRNSRAFARWFWTEKARDAELVCVKSDMGSGFDRRNWTLFRSALYLCNQKIYSPRHRNDIGANWNAVLAGRVLRCVLYNEWPEMNTECAAWLEGMKGSYDMRKRETFIINDPSHRDDGTDVEDRYTVFEFVVAPERAPLWAGSEGAAPVSRR